MAAFLGDEFETDVPRPDELAVAFEDGALTVRRWRGRVGPAARRGADGFLAALRGLATGLGLDGESDADEAYDEAAPQKKVKPIRVELADDHFVCPRIGRRAEGQPLGQMVPAVPGGIRELAARRAELDAAALEVLALTASAT